MAHRWTAMAAIAASTVVVVGCSSSSHKQASAAPAGGTRTTTPSTSSTLSTDKCVDVTGAQLDLATASTTPDARKAADSIEKYNPPADVKTAVEHFVTTKGIQFDDPQATAASATLKKWVDQVCPT